MYLLQLLDTELDELRELRGDLPDTVNQLEAQARDLEEKVADCENALKKGLIERDRKEKESLELIAKIDKYKGQQLEVHNNREYDALTREMETAEKTIAVYEAEIEDFMTQSEELRELKEKLESDLAELGSTLEEKRSELEDILQTTREEERVLEKKREDALSAVSKDDLEMYNRIRGAKNGKAVAPVRRGSCSGCYNVVPPQLILEIKKHDQLYICEHCGRILVSEEIATETTI
jgi:predicted  nucleic acid-binding Zn-ribbon protein